MDSETVAFGKSDQENPIKKTQINPASTQSQDQQIVTPPEEGKEWEEERYQIVKTLGEGGMGLVQLAHDSLLQREVALKTIKTDPWRSEHFNKKQEMLLWRLKKEAEITALLEHPNIVPLYDLKKKKNGEIYFTMRKVQGETFSDILKKKKEGESGLDQEDLLTIFTKMCDAVAYAHSQGVIHRDLKPENVMVGQFGEVYVMDWGIAKRINATSSFHVPDEASASLEDNISNNISEDDATKAKSTFANAKGEFKTLGGIGTFGYMAPEQAENAGEVREQADVHALGKILKQCFTYTSPMQEFKDILQQKQNIFVKQKNNEAQKSVTKKEELPEDIQAIIKKATQENWHQRYPSVKEFILDIERYRKNMRVSVRNYSVSQVLWKWIKRNQIAVSILMIVLSIFLSFWGYLKYEEQKEFEAHIEKAKQEKAMGATETRHEEKMEHYFNGLHSINSALLVDPKHSEVAKIKFELSQSLIKSACETRDFQFASYFVRGVESLDSLDLQTKVKLKEEVESAKTQSLRDHQKRLRYWMSALKDPQEGMRNEAILEISKMEEPEILDELAKEVKAGTQYFLASTERTPKKDEYYEVMALVLGAIGNPKAGAILWDSLDTIGQKMLHFKEGNRPYADVAYMVTLAQALSNSKSVDFAENLNTLRQQMGEYSLFTQRSKLSFKQLALLENLVAKREGNSFQDFLNRALLKSEINDHEGAIEDFTETLRLNPQLPEAYYRRGGSKFRTNDLDGAILDFSEAIRLDAKLAEVYTYRGLAKSDKDDLDGALEDHNEAIRLNPNFTEAYTNRGNLKHWRGDTSGAIADFTEAIRLNPQDAVAFRNRGIMKHVKGHFEEAILDFTEAIRLNPQEAQGYLSRGTTKYTKGDLDHALLDFNEAIRLNPQEETIYHNRGAAKKDKGDLDGAIADYDEALRRNPNNALTYYNRGIAKKGKGDLDGAILDYDEALRLNPQFVEAHYNQGFAKQAKGDRKGAIANFEAGLQIKPYPQMTKNLLDLLKQQSREDWTKKDWIGAKSTLLKLKQYLPADDPQQKQLEKKIQEVEQFILSQAK